MLAQHFESSWFLKQSKTPNELILSVALISAENSPKIPLEIL
jgi:hypothetical protein